MFGICVIGCGYIANESHAPALLKYRDENPGTALLGCCDSDKNKAMEFAKRFGFRAAYSDYRKMLYENRPSAVCLYASYVAIPKIASEVMQMGIPILMEKPPGTTNDEVSLIIDAAKKTNVLNQVAFNRRFTPIVNKLLRSIESVCEDIHNIRCIFQRVSRTDSAFYTTAIHGIDTVRHIAGSDYREARFRYQELPQVNKGAANIYMDCVMESGATAQLVFIPHGGRVVEDYYVSCLNNDFRLKMPIWDSLEYPGGFWHYRGNEIVECAKGHEFGDEVFERFGFFAENASFFDAVKNGEKTAHDIFSARQSVDVAFCMEKRQEVYKNETII